MANVFPTGPEQYLSIQLIITMLPLMLALLPAAAIGYSLLYLLFGGGFVGAVIIFIVAKMLGR